MDEPERTSGHLKTKRLEAQTSVRKTITKRREREEAAIAEAKKALEGLIKDKEVIVDTKFRDKFRRPVADVKVGNQSVNRAMQKYRKK